MHDLYWSSSKHSTVIRVIIKPHLRQTQSGGMNRPQYLVFVKFIESNYPIDAFRKK